MQTLRALTLGAVFAFVAAASAAEQPSAVPTITVTAKRHAAAPERLLPPQPAVETKIVLPTDMPEAVIHLELAPVGVSQAAVNRATS